MAPSWLTVLAWLYLAVCFGCAGIIAYDITVTRRRQPMGVMNFVYPITALYLGPFALALYWRWGRATWTAPPMSASLAAMSLAAVPSAGNRTKPRQHAHHDMNSAAGTDSAHERARPAGRARPWWVTIAIEVSHCGSGCTLGDVISEFVIFALGLMVAGATLGAEYVGDYILALAFASSSSTSRLRQCAASA